MEVSQTTLNKAHKKLEELNQRLEILEREKAELIKRYNSTTLEEKVLIEKEIQTSEENFKTLSEDAIRFSEKVKELKKKVSI